MEIIGYFASGLIGVTLGLIGGGGSILTVPVLVYLFHFEPTIATAYSLFIVGTSSLVGGVRKVWLREVEIKTVLVFAIPSILAVYLTRLYLVPIIPPRVLDYPGFIVTRDFAIMVFFATLMIVAAITMIKGRAVEKIGNEGERNVIMLILDGIAVGIVTGIVGAGGGFMIIPTLIIFAKMPMKKAVGTSLFIVAINSLIGFTADLQTGHPIDYPFLFKITAIAIVGIVAGTFLSHKIDGNRLKAGFGWFILVMGIYIISKEILL
jgi:uncharacterized membrane protein YfcA